MEKSVCVCVGGDGIITAVEEVVDKAMAMQNVEVRSSRSPDRLSITGLKFSLDHLSHFTLSSQHGENWWECIGGVNAHHNGCLTKFSQQEWGLLMTRLIYTCNELLITSAFSPQTAGSVLQLALKLTPGSRCVTAAWQDQSPRTGSGSRSECQLVSVLTVARFQRRETSRPLLSRDHFWCRLVWRCLSRCHGGQRVGNAERRARELRPFITPRLPPCDILWQRAKISWRQGPAGVNGRHSFSVWNGAWLHVASSPQFLLGWHCWCSSELRPRYKSLQGSRYFQMIENIQ